RAGQQAVEKALVKVVENLFQVCSMAVGRVDLLAPAHLANQVGLSAQGAGPEMPPVARGPRRIDVLAIKLGQENVGNSGQHLCRRAFQQIRKPYPHYAVAKTDSVVDVGKGIKAGLK